MFAYTPHQDLGNDKKAFKKNIQLIASIIENEMVITGCELNRHVPKEVEGYIGVHSVCEYGVKSTEDR